MWTSFKEATVREHTRLSSTTGQTGAGPVTTEIVEAQTGLTPLAEGALGYADLAGTAVITAPGGSVFEDTVLVYRHLPAPTPGVPADYGYAGRAFRLEGYQANQLVPDLVMGEALTLTLTYGAADVAGLDEARLGLFAWIDGRWSAAGIACQPEPALNRVTCTAQTLLLTEMMLAEPPHAVFLAAIFR